MWVVALVLLATSRVASAGLLPGDANAMASWQGTQLLTRTVGSSVVKAEVDYAVYAPGQFGASSDLGFPAGLDPSGGADYVYAYEVYNDPTATISLIQFSVGITKFDVPTNSTNIGHDPATIDLGMAPDIWHFNPTTGDPTSALWFFTSTTLAPGSHSDIVFFTSPFGPTMHSSSVLGSFTATANLPSPVPEPGTITLSTIAVVCVLAASCLRRRRLRSN